MSKTLEAQIKKGKAGQTGYTEMLAEYPHPTEPSAGIKKDIPKSVRQIDHEVNLRNAEMLQVEYDGIVIDNKGSQQLFDAAVNAINGVEATDLAYPRLAKAFTDAKDCHDKGQKKMLKVLRQLEVAQKKAAKSGDIVDNFERAQVNAESRSIDNKDTDWRGVQFNSKHFFTPDEISDLVKEINEHSMQFNSPGLKIGRISDSSIYIHQKKVTSENYRDFEKAERHIKIQVIDSKGIIFKRPLATVWLEHPLKRRYEGPTVFRPGLPPVSEVDGNLNIYTGLASTPVKGDKHLPWLDFIQLHDCPGDTEGFKWLMNYLKVMVQFPEHKIRTACAIVSEVQGTGKGIFIEDMLGRWLFGSHYIEFKTKQQFMDKFNTRWAGKKLIYANETGMKYSTELEEFVKTAVTSSTINIQPKGVDEMEAVQAFFSLFVSFNAKPGDGIKLSASDRRWTIIFSEKAGWAVKDFKAWCEKHLNQEAANNFLYYLLNDTVADIGMADTVYENAARVETMKVSAEPIDKFFLDLENIIRREIIVPGFEESFWVPAKFGERVKAVHMTELFKLWLKKEGYKSKYETNVIDMSRVLKRWAEKHGVEISIRHKTNVFNFKKLLAIWNREELEDTIDNPNSTPEAIFGAKAALAGPDADEMDF